MNNKYIIYMHNVCNMYTECHVRILYPLPVEVDSPHRQKPVFCRITYKRKRLLRIMRLMKLTKC